MIAALLVKCLLSPFSRLPSYNTFPFCSVTRSQHFPLEVKTRSVAPSCEAVVFAEGFWAEFTAAAFALGSAADWFAPPAADCVVIFASLLFTEFISSGFVSDLLSAAETLSVLPAFPFSLGAALSFAPLKMLKPEN